MLVWLLGVTLQTALAAQWPCDEATKLVKDTAEEFRLVRKETEAPKGNVRVYLKSVKKELVKTTDKPTHLEWLIDELLDVKCPVLE